MFVSPKKAKPAHLDLSKYKLKELAFGPQGEGATELPKRVEDVLEQGAPGDLAKTYVWYASYGSNLLEERFMCYVKGGKVSDFVEGEFLWESSQRLWLHFNICEGQWYTFFFVSCIECTQAEILPADYQLARA